jgi:hypothetical protein
MGGEVTVDSSCDMYKTPPLSGGGRGAVCQSSPRGSSAGSFAFLGRRVVGVSAVFVLVASCSFFFVR